MNAKQKIFTFWEPRETLPFYLRLCMDTWNKFLPDYEIIVLDYENLKDYIGNCYDNILYSNFSLAKQADAIRCAVLNRYGGIWLDTDTIITSKNFVKQLKYPSDFVLIGNHVGFIVAKSQAKILQKWEQEIRERLYQYKKYHTLSKWFYPSYYKKLKKWDYLGNGIIDKYLEIAASKHFYSVKETDIAALPEINFYNGEVSNPKTAYVNFWFNGNNLEYVLSMNRGGIICLHNSWTPQEYKNMSSNEFLNCNNTLSNLLRNLNDL